MNKVNLPENLMLWSIINSPCNIMPGRRKLKKTNSFLKKYNPQAFSSELKVNCIGLHHKKIKAKFPLRKTFSEMEMFLVICTTLRAKKLLNPARSHVDNNFS